MNKCLLMVLLLASSTTYASKARVSALQGADHLVDTQTVFTNPAHMNQLKPYITFEFGTAGTDAEGGYMKSLSSGAKLLAYVGHKNLTATEVRTTNGYLGQNNPVEVLYATGNMGFGASLSTVDNKKSGTKESTAVLKYGMLNDSNEFYVHVAAVSSAEKTAGTDKINAAPRVTLGGAIDSGEMRYFGALDYGSAKNEAAAGDTTIKDQNIVLGLEDRSMKTEASDIYVGAKVISATRDIEGKKITSTQLPVFLGLEHNINSWAIFRGSVSQNLLIGSTKDETATADDPEGIAPNTLVSAGLGFHHNNLTLDGALTAAGDGKINGNQFLAQTSVTYNF